MMLRQAEFVFSVCCIIADSVGTRLMPPLYSVPQSSLYNGQSSLITSFEIYRSYMHISCYLHTIWRCESHPLDFSPTAEFKGISFATLTSEQALAALHVSTCASALFPRFTFT